MKKDIAEFVAKCKNCQQVKYEHQRPVGILQRMSIPKWKWERIATDFIVGLPRPREGLTLFGWWLMDYLCHPSSFKSD